jgi:hypothetical protein
LINLFPCDASPGDRLAGLRAATVEVWWWASLMCQGTDSKECMMTRPMPLSELGSLPQIVDLLTAAGLLGIGRTTAYQLARAGRFPVPVLRVGVSYKVPTAPLLELLGRPAPEARSATASSPVAATGPARASRPAPSPRIGPGAVRGVRGAGGSSALSKVLDANRWPSVAGRGWIPVRGAPGKTRSMERHETDEQERYGPG